VGVAIREGHPVYFVIFSRAEPGQTLLDVCDAEANFVHKVRELHPTARSCHPRQLPGRMAAMMLASSNRTRPARS